jgi:hypothetical protein
MNLPFSLPFHPDSPFALLIPQPCPFPLIRIGGSSDGAYLLPDDLKGIEACYSPGVNNFKRFEDELAHKYGISSHMCDFSSDINRLETDLIPGIQTFQKKWLDVDGGPDSITLDEWVGTYSPSDSDLILQIDIEGAEYRNLLALSEDCLHRFRIIIIELHGLGSINESRQGDSPVEMLLRKLRKSHTAVHAHPNNCCGFFIDEETRMNIPNVIEVTYLRNDRFSGDPDKFIIPEIPNILDIECNVPWMPPIHLNSLWNNNQSYSSKSIQKIESDTILFEKRNAAEIKRSLESNKLIMASVQNLYSLYDVAPSSHDELLLTSLQSKDVAFGKKYFLSSEFTGGPLEGLVSCKNPFFFHTAFEQYPRITIDFGDIVTLSHLVISNRSDGFQDRAQCLLYAIHDDINAWFHSPYPVCICPDFFLADSADSHTFLGKRKGRFLSVFSPLVTALHFSQLKII